MFCPQCGNNQSDDLKFCKTCGTNLNNVRQVVTLRDVPEDFNWSKTWVAEMFLSEAERKVRAQENERRLGITPEIKRFNEIKAGVITSSVGVALMIFLYFLMQGIITGGKVTFEEASILSKIWIAGVIPFFVGMGLMINGTYVSKKLIEATREQYRPELNPQERESPALSSADTSEFIPANLSVTEGTTRHLSQSEREK
jgi:hypothetical protein